MDLLFALLLACAALWSTAFSMTNRYPRRSLRNLGIAGAYVAGIVMFVRLPWRTAAATWVVFGLLGGLACLGYEVLARSRMSPEERKQAPLQLSLLAHGLLAWPVMVPEAVEYTLATLGILKGAGDKTPAPPAEGA